MPPDVVALSDRVKGWRPTILSSATTVDEARWLEAHGVEVEVHATQATHAERVR